MQPSDVLTEAKKLIEDPEDWTQGALRSLSHNQHCATGALLHANGNCLSTLSLTKSFRKLEENITGRPYLVKAAEYYLKTHQSTFTTLSKRLLHNLKNDELTDRFLIICINDYFGHKAVLAIYDHAIKLAQEAGE